MSATVPISNGLPDEEELVRRIVAAMGRANRQVADEHRHGLRDAHAKSHGIPRGRAAHRPLGSIMRSRRHAYPSSSEFRHAVNGIVPHEPSNVEELPA